MPDSIDEIKTPNKYDNPETNVFDDDADEDGSTELDAIQTYFLQDIAHL